MDIRQTRKGGSLFFRSYPSLFCVSKIKGDFQKLKDYFVSDSYLFNRWMEVYSGSEFWGVLPYFFYQRKAPISILFLLYININVLLDIFKNIRY